MSGADTASVLSGAEKRLTGWYELALFVAWHVAAFTNQAQHGKLEPFATYRRKLLGTSSPAPAPPQDWRARKAERQAQMDLLKKHQQQRKAPPRQVRRG